MVSPLAVVAHAHVALAGLGRTIRRPLALDGHAAVLPLVAGPPGVWRQVTDRREQLVEPAIDRDEAVLAQPEGGAWVRIGNIEPEQLRAERIGSWIAHGSHTAYQHVVQAGPEQRNRRLPHLLAGP